MATELDTWRIAKAMQANDAAAKARDRLDTDRQLELAHGVLDDIGSPRNRALAHAMVDALELAVDGHCNRGETSTARELAQEKGELLGDPAWGTLKMTSRRPGSLATIKALRIYAHAIELDGDPDDAMSRLMALDVVLYRYPMVGDDERVWRSLLLGDPAHERLLILRGVLSSAKRSGDARARAFADRARGRGDDLAARLEHKAPGTAASYWHRAACEARARLERPSQVAPVIELFERSLPLRRNVPRDHRTRGMTIGELHVLRGDRARGAAVLTETVESFAVVLPRHHDSARTQLIERDLLLSA
jgi:hypothetical protein